MIQSQSILDVDRLSVGDVVGITRAFAHHAVLPEINPRERERKKKKCRVICLETFPIGVISSPGPICSLTRFIRAFQHTLRSVSSFTFPSPFPPSRRSHDR